MNNEVKFLYLDDIIPNRFQPRENFDEQALKELAVSIKEHGVIQPIIVRQVGEKYEIIAGERRYKAATMAGLTKIPAIVNNLDDKESSKVALIENLQRRDLTAIEEARTYQKILELDALTQEDLAKTMGKSQSAVSNKLRLLTLPEEVQDALLHEQISERHARSLLNVNSPEKQVELLNKVIGSRMTVRELDQEIKNLEGNQMQNQNMDMMGAQNLDINNQNGDVINPTTVDVDRLRNESTDISMQQQIPVEQPPQMSFNNLMGPEKPLENFQNNYFDQNTLPPFGNNINNEGPIGGNGLLAGIPAENTVVQQPFMNNIPAGESNMSNIDNNYNGFENGGYNGVEVENNMMPNNTMYNNDISNNGFGEQNYYNQNQMINQSNQMFNSNISNISDTVSKIKNSIDSIRNEGSKIELQEYDFDDFYQIVIRIDK